MLRYLIIGICAGLVSALLFASTATGSAFAIVLFYLAPLPLYVVALGWGTFVSLVAAGAGALTSLAVTGPYPTILFLASIAAPAFWLTRLALLARPVDPVDPASPREWYPMGRLVVWAASLGGVLVGLALLLLGFDAATIEQRLGAMFDALIAAQGDAALPEGFDQATFVSIVARVVPPASAAIWMITTLANLWLAGRIVAVSGRSIRPPTPFTAIAFPKALAGPFVAATLLAFAPGMIGLMASLFAATFLLAYSLLGLAVVHVVTRGMNARPFILTGLYFALFVFWWSVVVVAVIGVLEPVFRWRDRALAKP